jgi:hypothetical protein
MASSSSRSEKDGVVRNNRVPAALLEQMGTEATGALLEVIDRAHEERKTEMIAAALEQFDTRLAGEGALIRREIAAGDLAIRQDMTKMESSLRADLTKMESALRGDMSKMESTLRADMSRMEAVVRQDTGAGRVELLKWCFVFWIGQVLALASLFAVMIRMRP